MLSREVKFLELWFDDLNISGGRYGDGWDLCWVYLSSIVLSSESKVTTGCGDELEDNFSAHKICLVYKKLPTRKNSNHFHLLVCTIVKQKEERRLVILTILSPAYILTWGFL